MWANLPLLADLQLFPPHGFRAGRTDRFAVLVPDDRFGNYDGADFHRFIFFAWKYRRRARRESHADRRFDQARVDLVYSSLFDHADHVLVGCASCISQQEPPKNAMEVFVTGKQWMWKMQYPDGRREINELHVPVGQPVKLTMASRGCDSQLLDSSVSRPA